ncbi:hypothetical protein pb186bvf_018419 [Paramecium bursaria]
MSKQYISEKAQERVFNLILKRPDNQICADCSCKGPRWVSLDFGVFICMDCAGAHRTLGPSVTRVRSTNIDGWYQENVDLMEAIGNAAANSYWENTIPGSFQKPTINAGLDSLIRFVQEKYVKKRFVPDYKCPDPKSFYVQTQKSVKPYYFQVQPNKPPVEVKTQLGDLIELNDDNDFQSYQSIEPVKFNSEHTSLQSLPETPQQILPQSSPQLDIMNLYKTQQQPQQQQNQRPQSNYQFLYQYPQPQSQPAQPQQQYRPQQQQFDIMQLYKK